ncbi:fimbrial protein [Kosakonia sp. ML.JS2a]|uniref:fimbrial protein n=1 Tax=Kosakonia sp. ML.JS2a TaxID=2980557 RepID=UPI0021D92810|nr:fimbrial protein [Kosakonia sp. ML.JS2a]UXY10874.1 fimbrial protein [Kosakonia sp. ML.JS2a]
MTFIRICLLSLSLFTSLSLNAKCVKGPDFVRTELSGWGVSLALGTINITNSAVQPVGSPLAANVVNFYDNPRYTKGPESIMWVCDIADKNNIYEIIATNGNDRNGGFFDIGAFDGYPNYYATLFRNVAIRLTHVNSGRVFTRNYQRIPMTNYVVSPDGLKIYIRLKDFSPIRAELIRVSSTTSSGQAPSDYCAKRDQLTSGSYTCNQPNGYVSFCSEGSPDAYCDVGDSAYIYNGWWKDNWMSINMGGVAPMAELVSKRTCTAKSVTPVVTFPPITVDALNNGGKSQGTFTVNILCEGLAGTGTVSGLTALGMQVPYENYQAALRLNLVNSSGGVSYLLPTDLGVSGMASGVGIQISNANDGMIRNFIGWQRCNAAPSNCATGEAGGWYDAREGAQVVNNGGTLGISEYAINFNAYLSRIGNQTVRAGQVYASAQILVKVQ